MEWLDFIHAINAKDAKSIIAIATPDFVARNKDCLEHYCCVSISFDVDDDDMVVSHLFAMGAECTKGLLHGAAVNKRIRIVVKLLSIGCDPNIAYDDMNESSLDFCVNRWRKNKWDWGIIRLLIDAGGELRSAQDLAIQSIIDYRKAARVSAIAVVGVGREKGKKDVFQIIARNIWSQRMK
jgi:hypothetical protein